MPDDKKEATIRDIMDEVYAMTPEEFSKYMAWNFHRLCSKPIPEDDAEER